MRMCCACMLSNISAYFTFPNYFVVPSIQALGVLYFDIGVVLPESYSLSTTSHSHVDHFHVRLAAGNFAFVRTRYVFHVSRQCEYKTTNKKSMLSTSSFFLLLSISRSIVCQRETIFHKISFHNIRCATNEPVYAHNSTIQLDFIVSQIAINKKLCTELCPCSRFKEDFDNENLLYFGIIVFILVDLLVSVLVFDICNKICREFR